MRKQSFLKAMLGLVNIDKHFNELSLTRFDGAKV